MNRERLSRLGFILVSAGCAIGLGNVWKFPYLCGANGGAAFLLIYLFFLVIFGLPVLLCEFAIGRASQRSIARCFDVLTPQHKPWRLFTYFGIIGCHLLMMFYTMVCGWMFYYAWRSIRGDFIHITPDAVGASFGGMLGDPVTMVFWTLVVCIAGYGVCYLGVKRGLEGITKWMMMGLFVLMIVLAVNSVLMPGASKGVSFFLVPDFDKLFANGVGNVVFAALSQAFFTLGLGVGSMLIFGSYIQPGKSLLPDSLSVLALDTLVAITSGFIIIPACFTFGIEPGAGPGLVFVTLPNIFSQLSLGHLWGSVFFIFMSVAAFSTVVAVFECLCAIYQECFGWSRHKSAIIGGILMCVLSMPCVLGFNVLSGIEPMGKGTNIMDLEDFILSYNLLSLGALGFIFYCTQKTGWGWENFLKEIFAQQCTPRCALLSLAQLYMKYIMPAIIMVIYLKGYYDTFAPRGTTALCISMVIACLCIVLTFFAAGTLGQCARRKQ